MSERLEATLCGNCAAEVLDGPFCEACGAPLHSAERPTEPPAGVAVSFVPVTGFRGEDTALGVRIEPVATGTGVVAVSLDEADPAGTWAGAIRLRRPGVAHAHAVDGLGTLSAAPGRWYGVVADGGADTGRVRLHVGASGDGLVAVVSVARSALTGVELRTGRQRRVTGVTLGGEAGELSLDAHAELQDDGAFRRTDNALLVATA